MLRIGGQVSISRPNPVVRMSRHDSQAVIRFVAGVLRIEPERVLLTQLLGEPLRRRQATRIDALIVKVRDAIDHLKELRTALISAAVTGKIDVREEVA